MSNNKFNAVNRMYDVMVGTYQTDIDVTTGLPYMRVSRGDPTSINNAYSGAGFDVIAEINPSQDLNGYDMAWPPGYKNLLPYPYFDGTKTEEGVTYTPGTDGKLTLSGEAYSPSSYFFNNVTIPAGTYTLKASGASDIRMQIYEQYDYQSSVPMVSAGTLNNADISGSSIVRMPSPTHYLVCYQATPNTEYYGLINGYTVGVPAIGANVYDYYAGSNNRRVYIDDSESEVYLICKTGDPVYELATIADAEMSDATFTLSAEKRCGVTCRVARGTIPYGDNIVIEPQFESGSASTSYMAYSNICAISGHDSVTVTQTGASEHTYSVSFPSPNPGTVYGGTFDFASGKLTVTHVCYTFTSNEDVSYHVATQFVSEYVYFNTAQNAIMPTMKSGVWTSDSGTMCNMFPKYSGSGQTLCIRFGTNTYGRYIFIYNVSDLSVSSASDMKSWLAANSLTVTYPLETPIVYRLTPVELESLDLGTTTFQCDTGAVTVKYYIPQQVPVITVQPQSQTVSVGNTVTLSVTATASQSMPLTYQWQYSNNQGTTWNNNTASGYNQPVFSFKATQSMDGRMYRCVISNNAGTVISNTATVTIGKPKEE